MRAREIASLMPSEGASLPADLRRATEALENRKGEGFSALITMLREALSDELPMLARDGGFIAKDYDAGLDSVRLLRDESRRVIAGLESKYRDLAGLKNLKIVSMLFLLTILQELRPIQTVVMEQNPQLACHLELL